MKEIVSKKFIKIGVNFGDNDFGGVAYKFFQNLELEDRNWYKNIEEIPEIITKSKLVYLWNSIVPKLYLMSKIPYINQQTEFNPEEYFKIDESEVYLNDEVDKFLEEHTEGERPWFNGEFIYINLVSVITFTNYGEDVTSATRSIGPLPVVTEVRSGMFVADHIQRI